jgi:hypothetical protein
MEKINPSTIIMAFVTIVIGASLVTPMANILWVNTTISNITGAAYALYTLILLFFVILVVVAAVKHIK